MREYKFRAWNNELGMSNVFCIDQGMFEAEPDAVMQYTGLKDKNGKEIFEGDIVVFHQQIMGQLIEDGYTGIVKFEQCCFTVDNEKQQESVPIFDEVGMWEVLGNIFENEELASKFKLK